MAGEVASQGVQISTVYMPLVQTKMVQSKGHSYDHFSMLTVDMACELIEHAIISKDCEVMDGPTRFLALVYFCRPSLIVALNSLVYGLESEQAPDGLRRAKSEHEMERRRKRNAQGGFTPLKALGSLLSFFAQLEMFWRRIGVVSIVRDPIIILILLLVLAVELVVATVMAVTSMVRRSVRSIRARLGRKVDLCEVDGSGDHVKEEQPMQPKILRSSSASHEAVVPPADANLSCRKSVAGRRGVGFAVKQLCFSVQRF
mmetsp:Transcript_32279/g.102397  ORF Transcript_32279/g.102397 Transcript_32279/m.102397 type:complete len:258 (-) Transcript_32279:266-1039(-)